MTGARPAEILRHLAPSDAAGPDRELLRRFADTRDQRAFAELVRRHGPVVLGVCRRVAGHPQDAEDAFQAVFLVLARKAAKIANPELIGNWLYGVAVRVAQKARRTAARRRAREVQVTAMPDPPSSPVEFAPDIGPVLHEELARLPEWYREPLVLCDLRGVPRADAAKALGIPEGTLSSRLANGRKKLADRLARRGVALSVAAVPLVLGEGRAAVPDELLRTTCGLVADWAAGGAVPGPVGRLAEGGFTVRKMMLIGIFAAAVTAAGVALAGRPKDSPNTPPTPPVVAAPAADPKPVPLPDPDAKPEVQKVAIGAPKLRKAIDLPVRSTDEIAWAPDGKGLAVRAHLRARPGQGGLGQPERNEVVYIPDVFAEPQQYLWITLPPAGTLVGFTRGLVEDTLLVTAVREYHLVSGFHKLDVWARPDAKVPDAGFGRPKVPEDERADLRHVRTVNLEADQTYGYHFAPDGKSFRTVYRELGGAGIGVLEVREVDARDGKTTKVLGRVEGEFSHYVLSADGKRLVTFDLKDVLTAHDAATGKKQWEYTAKFEDPAFAGLPLGGSPASGNTYGSVQLSPDGKRLVATRGICPPVVLDADAGKPLAVPENTSLTVSVPSPDCFSPDGRLLVLTGQRFTMRENKGGLGGKQPRQMSVESTGSFLSIWDAGTGKAVKTWDRPATVRFLPNRPVLAVFESNGGGTRLGLWDFAADEKK